MKTAKAIVYGMMIAITAPLASFGQDKPSSVPLLLSKYYDIKNALVNSDVASAEKAASEFVTAAKNIDAKVLPAKLLTDANSIVTSKDIAKQRTSFQTLSESMISLTKSATLNAPVYIAFCPMKKAYWISPEQAIKNPYFGNSMLTCGKITDTLK